MISQHVTRVEDICHKNASKEISDLLSMDFRNSWDTIHNYLTFQPSVRRMVRAYLIDWGRDHF